MVHWIPICLPGTKLLMPCDVKLRCLHHIAEGKQGTWCGLQLLFIIKIHKKLPTKVMM